MKKGKRFLAFVLCIIMFGLVAMGSDETPTSASEGVTNKPATSSTASNTTSSSVKAVDEVTVKVTNKKNQAADIMSGRYSDRVIFTISVTNNTKKDIKGVQGVLTIKDLFGTKILSSTCDFTGTIIPAGKTVTISDKGLDVNEFMDSHVKLYNEKFEDLSFSYSISTVVYADGNDNGGATTTTGMYEDVIVVCTDKKNISADYSAGRYSAYSQFVFEVSNLTGKDIRGVQGVVTISDLFGKEIKKFNCNFTGTTIPAGKKVKFSDKYLEINEFIDEEVKIYNEDFADLQFTYKVTDIVYVE